METIQAPAERIPRFSLLAGIGGVFIYILSSAPIVLIVGGLTAAELLSENPDVSRSDLTREINDAISSQWVICAALITQCVCFCLYAFGVSKIRGTKNFRNDLGLKFTPSCLWFFLVGIGMQIAGLVVSLPLHMLKDDIKEQEVVTSFRDSSGAAFIVLILLVAIVVPTVEEMCFRGLFLRGLSKKAAPLVSAFICALVFAGIHFSDSNAIMGAAVLFAVGFLAALLAVKRGRIDASVMLHMGFNSTTAFFLIVSRFVG